MLAVTGVSVGIIMVPGFDFLDGISAGTDNYEVVGVGRCRAERFDRIGFAFFFYLCYTELINMMIAAVACVDLRF